MKSHAATVVRYIGCAYCSELFHTVEAVEFHQTALHGIGISEELLREDKTGKVDYTYLSELKPIIDRICTRLTEGEKKYARLNWRNCEDNLTYKQSAMRHMMQYMNGETDEDHGIATIINLMILLDLEDKEVF